MSGAKSRTSRLNQSHISGDRGCRTSPTPTPSSSSTSPSLTPSLLSYYPNSSSSPFALSSTPRRRGRAGCCFVSQGPPPTTSSRSSTSTARSFIPWDRRTGESRGFAFVRYKYADEAQKAVDKLDGRVVDGREIGVQFAKYGPNAERIDKGKIAEPVSKIRRQSRSRSPRPRSLVNASDMALQTYERSLPSSNQHAAYRNKPEAK